MKQDNENRSNQCINDTENNISSDSRRKALRNILSGTGIVAGAQLATGSWIKPVVESVVLPAHAQTSGIILAGVASTGGITGILDILVQPTYAQLTQVPQGCVFLYFFGPRVTVEHFSNAGGVDSKVGMLEGNNFSIPGLHDLFVVNGTVDDPASPTVATGTVSGDGGSASFTASPNTNACRTNTPPPIREVEQ